MINVTLYQKPGDPACVEVQRKLASLRERFPHNLIEVDITADSALLEKFASAIPVVMVGPYHLKAPITETDLVVALGAASDRAQYLDKVGDTAYQQRKARGRQFSFLDRFSQWVSTHYLGAFILILFLYVSVPFLGPVFMKAGWTGAARVVYSIYSPLCHQLAFRSWFLWGEQAYYPRSLSGITDVITYETMMNIPPGTNEKTDEFILTANQYVGDKEFGYKVALCERDLAMYGSFMLFCVVFALSGRKIRQVKWFVWLILGVLPIALDGISQLPSLFPGMPDFFPYRESTPLFRTLTGFSFGIFTAWYLIPLVEESMRETRALFASKQVIVRESSSLRDK